jgi:glyoxylase-like metal-dependent hydrolase (beta-lactamase superfamily II)
MRLHRILPGLAFAERGYLNGNQVVATGGAPGVVDTGYVTGWEGTERILAEVGLSPEGIRLVVNTHAHCDHVGGNRRLQERSGCEIALHPLGRRHVEAGDDRATWTGYFDLDADPFRPTRSLADGDVVRLGDHDFTVFHAPGHSADSLVLHEPREGVLISGDTLWEADVGLVNPFVEGREALASHLSTLDRLEGLNVRWVLPGHGRPFQGFAEALAESRRRLRRFIGEPAAQGTALLRKMFVFKLLIRPGIPEHEFERHVVDSPWYRETVGGLLAADPGDVYRTTLDDLLRKGACRREDGRLTATART